MEGDHGQGHARLDYKGPEGPFLLTNLKTEALGFNRVNILPCSPVFYTFAIDVTVLNIAVRWGTHMSLLHLAYLDTSDRTEPFDWRYKCTFSGTHRPSNHKMNSFFIYLYGKKDCFMIFEGLRWGHHNYIRCPLKTAYVFQEPAFGLAFLMKYQPKIPVYLI